MSRSIVIAGGGTGGHVYPGLALAEAIRLREPEAEVAFVGTASGLEATAVPSAGFALETVDVLPWSRPLGLKRYLAPLSALRAVFQARRILRRRRVRAVAGMGGYASLPVALAARSMNIPLVIHEQNAVPGKSNRLASHMTDRVAVSFPDAARSLGGRVRVTGNPIRRAIAHMDRAALRTEARAFFDLDPEPSTVLFLGGSLGARTINEAALTLNDSWHDRSDVQILLVAGRTNESAVRERARGRLTVVGYAERMEYAYAAADLVVGRSGAGIAELACAGLGSVLVPYPFHRDRQQEANARVFERAGASVIVPDSRAEDIGAAVEALLRDPEKLETMGKAARTLARPDAADELATWVLEAATT